MAKQRTMQEPLRPFIVFVLTVSSNCSSPDDLTSVPCSIPVFDVNSNYEWNLICRRPVRLQLRALIGLWLLEFISVAESRWFPTFYLWTWRYKNSRSGTFSACASPNRLDIASADFSRTFRSVNALISFVKGGGWLSACLHLQRYDGDDQDDGRSTLLVHITLVQHTIPVIYPLIWTGSSVSNIFRFPCTTTTRLHFMTRRSLVFSSLSITLFVTLTTQSKRIEVAS